MFLNLRNGHVHHDVAGALSNAPLRDQSRDCRDLDEVLNSLRCVDNRIGLILDGSTESHHDCCSVYETRERCDRGSSFLADGGGGPRC